MTVPPPLFVGGTGRSGTTIVARLLGSHPDYHMIPIEVRFIVDEEGLCDLVAGRCELSRFEKHVQGRWWHRNTRKGQTRGLHKIMDREVLEDALERLRKDFEHDPLAAGRRFVFDLLDPVAGEASARAWIEMTPPNVLKGRELAQLIPEMRLVHSTRDGRDVAASVARMFWGPDDPFDALDWWAERMLRAHRACHGLSDRLLVVQMEDLVSRAREDTLERLLDFVGFESRGEVKQYFDEQLDPKRAHTGRWRAMVPPDDHPRFERTYRDHLDRLSDAGVAVPE